MDLLRQAVNWGYDTFRDRLFESTKDDCEVAHNSFISLSQKIDYMGLSNLLLKQKSHSTELPFSFTNAAGFNKNGEIPPRFLHALGFTGNVVGTVTHDSWKGNEIPRILRFVETSSVINWMGLPGIGSLEVAANLEKYSGYTFPTTVNIMGTPGKTGESLLKDLSGTISDLQPYADAFELNISCPNTHDTSGEMDARDFYQRQLENMLETVTQTISDGTPLYLKISPDLTIESLIDILEVTSDYSITGFVGTNTTTLHDPKYVDSPGKGGASGLAVCEASQRTQHNVTKLIDSRKLDLSYIACGGIDSADSLYNRRGDYVTGFQVYTGLIFRGPRLLSEIHDTSWNIFDTPVDSD
ncbi:MAG: dihydroorotate dehydrogenase [Patescibacteria group bacterium]|jgi:dihydroorotate dehydrogenase